MPIPGRKKKSSDAVLKAKLLSLKKSYGGASHVAEAVHVDKSRVSRWLKGAAPDAKNAKTISSLEFVLHRLTTFLREETALKWLEAENNHLARRRPLDLILQDRVADVISAVDQEKSGSYA